MPEVRTPEIELRRQGFRPMDARGWGWVHPSGWMVTRIPEREASPEVPKRLIEIWRQVDHLRDVLRSNEPALEQLPLHIGKEDFLQRANDSLIKLNELGSELDQQKEAVAKAIADPKLVKHKAELVKEAARLEELEKERQHQLQALSNAFSKIRSHRGTSS